MIKFSTYITFVIVFLLILTSFFVVNHILSQETTNEQLWGYQCIDTMKISRDAARSEGTNSGAQKEIENEVNIIKKLGANCVAVATPYDEEFVPYLHLWVEEARKENLHVWFRGNFAGWEGWFDYPKAMTTQDHLIKTKQFIITHPDLFADGDIFTPATEAENGWGDGYVPQSDFPLFRQFLIDEHTNAQAAFAQIGKHVTTNWLSMSGGLAKDMLDSSTIRALDNTVTIDHYVDSPESMKEYIDYFQTNFHAKVVIGEFGAPIPDINGEMSDEEQASFVNSILNVLFDEKNVISGVNYWTLNNSSTALVNDTNILKPVANILLLYYKPKVITGQIIDELGDPIPNATITINNKQVTVYSDNAGQYSLSIPQRSTDMIISQKDYETQEITLSSLPYKKFQQNIHLKPEHPSMMYQLRLTVNHFFTSLFHASKNM